MDAIVGIYNSTKFLSTPSARRATMISTTSTACSLNFYPRPLRGGRPRNTLTAWWLMYFYPRPLRGGRPV